MQVISGNTLEYVVIVGIGRSWPPLSSANSIILEHLEGPVLSMTLLFEAIITLTNHRMKRSFISEGDIQYVYVTYKLNLWALTLL